MVRWLAVGMLAAFLGGCNVGPQGRVTGGNPGIAPPKDAIFATQLAGPKTFLPPMPTAVVILKPDDMSRNRAFCTAVMKLPTAQEANAASVVAPNLILTRWLTQLSEVPADRVRDCDYLAGTYDYGRAAALMAALRAPPGALSGRGPFLAMVIADGTGLRVLAVDGSGYDAANFDGFVASWKEAVDRTQLQISAQPDRPGVARSIFDLASAILRTVFGAAAGLIQGTVNGL